MLGHTKKANCYHQVQEISSGMRDKKAPVSPKLRGFKEQQFSISHDSTGLVELTGAATVSWRLCQSWLIQGGLTHLVGAQLGRLG